MFYCFFFRFLFEEYEMIEVDYSAGHEDYQGYWCNRCNSAGGLGVRLKIKNLDPRSIKYASLYFVPFNKVGDIVSSSVHGGRTKHGLMYTGPLAQGQKSEWNYLENVWYDYSISKVKLVEAKIEYMDGTTETIPGDQINRIGTSSSSGDGGCYIATSVYGSYDCPPVWTLRRFRDNVLSQTWVGRAFVHVYYAISPQLVALLGDTNWFKISWKKVLDCFVSKLQKNGFESTPYQDKKW